jgi:hypothetical protein
MSLLTELGLFCPDAGYKHAAPDGAVTHAFSYVELTFVYFRDFPVKIAVPAQEERSRGARAASEPARAGTIEVRPRMACLATLLTFGDQPILNAGHYTRHLKTVNDFL